MNLFTTFALLAIGFGNLPMLAWLAAAAAPWLIHLWSRRRYRETSWAAMQYLLAAMKKNSRRMQIEQWLLLAVRTLLLATIALAVAEPYLERTGLKFFSGQHAHKVLVLDGSYSMSYRPGDRSRFERAQELARRIVEESPQGDGFTLLVLADPPRTIVGAPAFEHASLIEEIDSLKPLHGGLDLPATLTRVEETLVRARREHPRLEREEIYWLTDLGRQGWGNEIGPAAALAEFRERSQRLGRSALVTVIDLGQAESDNTAIAELKCTQPAATLAQPVSVEVRMRNFGRRALQRQRVELLLDGRRVAETTVDLPSDGESAARFTARFDRPGAQLLEARLEADQLDVDNHRWLSLDVREAVRVLCINGKPAGGAFQGATDYLVAALAPSADRGNRDWVQVDVATEAALVEGDLERYDCLFLANMAQFTAAEAAVLSAYLELGRGLVFFLGDQVRPESYNRYLGGDEGKRLLPARLAGLSPEGLFHFDPIDYTHPIVDDFLRQERAGLLSALVYRYQRLAPVEASTAKIALRFAETGDAAIIEEPRGRGRVVVCATAPDATWSTWPVGPSFVPIVHEMLDLSLADRGADRNVLVGQAIGSVHPALASQVSVALTTPDGGNETVEMAAEGDLSRWSFSQTALSGEYLAQLGPPLGRQQRYAVNVDPRESDLASIDADELRNKVWPGTPLVHRTNWQDLDERPEGEISQRSGLHRALLYAVLLLLAADSILAWGLGRHRR